MNIFSSTIIGGHYEIVSQIGKGNFCETYLAKDKYAGNINRAIKRLKFTSNNPDLFHKAKVLFEREASVLMRLTENHNHKQIPKFFAFFDENQEFYLVQEFIEGDTLAEELRQKKAMSEGEVLDLLKQVLPILQFIHSQGIIHRDITPGNLIRRDVSKEIVLIDFGAVKDMLTVKLNPTGQTNQTLIYTPSYAPPELYQGNPQFNSDIYSLGICAIQALTGLKAEDIPKDNTGKIIWKHLIPVDKKLADIIDNMVISDFNTRYQSALEVLEAIQDLGGTLIVSPQSIPPGEEEQETESFVFPIWFKFAGLASVATIVVSSLSFFAVRSIFPSGASNTNKPSTQETTVITETKPKNPVTNETAGRQDKTSETVVNSEEQMTPKSTVETQKTVISGDIGDSQLTERVSNPKPKPELTNSEEGDIFLRPKSVEKR